jgi:HEAT repeat protein
MKALLPNMNCRLIFCLFCLFLGAALPAGAADLSQAIAEAARYESGVSTEPLRQIEKAVRESAGDAAQRAEVETALIKLLAPSSTYEGRRFACTQLAILGSEAMLPALSGLLKESNTVGIACLALGSLPSSRANEMLRGALATTTGRARLQITVTLGNRRDAECVKALAALARSVDGAAAETAISSLGKIASPAALEELATLRQKGDPFLSRAAAAASLVAADLVAQAGDAPAALRIYTELLDVSRPGYVRRAAFTALLRLEPDKAEARIADALTGKDANVKPVAIAAIRSLKSADASAKFAKEMSKLAPAEQVLMIDALASRNDEAALTAISGSLTAEDGAVRRAAVAALGNIGGVQTVPLLAKALTAAKETEDRQAIAAALTSLKGGEPVDQAIAGLLKEKDETALPILMSVLGKRGSHAAVPALLEQTTSTNAAIVKAAFQALGNLAVPGDLPALLERLSAVKATDARGPAESAVAKLLSKQTDPAKRSEAVLGALAKAGNTEARASLLGLLPACGDARSLDALKTAREEKEPGIRDAALRALADWPDASAVDALLEAAQNPAQDTERVLALRGVVRLLGATADASPSATAARFEKIMALAKNADEKKLVLGGLGRVHDLAALKLAASCLGDKAVQAEAALAAVTITPYVSGADRETAKATLQKVVDLPVEAELKQSAKDLKETIDRFADFMVAWQVAGPFTKEGSPGKDLFDVEFPPEQNDAKGVVWQTMPAGTEKDKPWLLDLGKLYGGENCAAYARALVYSENSQPARLELGSDDGVKAWVNGKVVIAANRGGAVIPGDQKAEITLQQGWNTVLMKVTQWTAGWGFCARLAKPDGTTLSGTKTQAAPPQ